MAIPRTRNSLLFAVLAFLPTAGWAAAVPDPGELLDAALSAPARSYQGRLMVTQWSGRQTRAEDVRIFYSPANRYRWEFLRPDGSVSRIAISDGAREQIMLLREGKTLSGESERGATKLMFPEKEKELLLQNYRLSVSGPDKIAGRAAWVLELDPLDPGKPHQQLWFDQETRVILAIKRYLPKKHFATLSRFTHFEPKPSLPETLFALKADSAAVVDTTPDFLSIEELEKATGRRTDLAEELPGGFAFESADFFEVGKDIVRHLRYTDGLAVVSIFLTDRPVHLPADGTTGPSRLSPPGSLRLSSTGKVLAFKRGRQHYTLMSDVSRELLERIAAGAAAKPVAVKISAPAPPAPEYRIRWTKLAGSVESIEPAGLRLWVKAKAGKSRDFAVTETTEILRQKKPAGFADIKAGDKVRLLRYNSATREIKRIELSGSK